MSIKSLILGLAMAVVAPSALGGENSARQSVSRVAVDSSKIKDDKIRKKNRKRRRLGNRHGRSGGVSKISEKNRRDRQSISWTATIVPPITYSVPTYDAESPNPGFVEGERRRTGIHGVLLEHGRAMGESKPWGEVAVGIGLSGFSERSTLSDYRYEGSYVKSSVREIGASMFVDLRVSSTSEAATWPPSRYVGLGLGLDVSYLDFEADLKAYDGGQSRALGSGVSVGSALSGRLSFGICRRVSPGTAVQFFANFARPVYFVDMYQTGWVGDPVVGESSGAVISHALAHGATKMAVVLGLGLTWGYSDKGASR